MVMSAPLEAPKTETSRDGRDRFLRKDFIYIVAVLHDTDHGPQEAVVQVTASPYKAVETARKIEELGYQFSSDKTSVSVYSLEINKQYNKLSFRLPDDGKVPTYYPVVFRRYRERGEWCEEWFSEALKFLIFLHKED